MNEILQRIESLRKSKDITVYRLMKDLNMSQSTYSTWLDKDRIPKTDKLQQLAEYFNVSLDYLTTGEENTEAIKLNDAARLPIYGSIPAGIPKEAIQDIEGYIEVPAYMSDGYFVLRIIGDSMYPKYLDGDVVIIKEQPDCESGQDCAVRINGNDVTLKKVIKMQDGLMLQPLNPDYTPQFFDYHDELCPVYILGVVVEIRRKV